MDQLPITINFQNKDPLTEQITDEIRALIHAHILKPGDPLPTVRQLAFQLGVNFNTVARAYRVLDAEGLIVTWQGRGTFVEESKAAPTADENIIPNAQQLIDMLFEQVRVLGIPESFLWEALHERQAAYPVSSAETRKKTQRISRRTVSIKGDDKVAKRGISLLPRGNTTYRRVRRTKRKSGSVSRGTF